MKNSQTIETIRQAVDIVQVISEVVPLKKSGGNYFGVCPFHNEKTPSMSVSPTKQMFHCFGCKAGGDVFKFVQLFHRCEFPQALEELARRAGIKLEAAYADPQWEEGFLILDLASKAFEEGLRAKNGKSFRDYLSGRKVPEKLWAEFQLGAHSGGPKQICDLLQKKGLNLDIAVRLGLLGRSPSGEIFDRFQGRLMFPIKDEKGRTRGFGGRSLGNDHPKYINSPKTSHFDKSRLFYGINLACKEISRKGYAVLVEGYLDVISLHEFGITNTVGSMGTSLTTEQIRVLKRLSSRVVSLYDADRAGLTATEKNLGNFFREGLESKVVLLPGAKDPDSFLHDESHSLEDRKVLLRKAFEDSAPALDYLVQHTILNEVNAQVRGQRLRGLVTIIDQVPDEIQRAVLRKDIAQRFDLPEQMLTAKSEKTEAPQPKQPSDTIAILAGADRWEREILKFVVKFGERETFNLGEAVSYLVSGSKWTSLILRLAELQLDSRAIAQLQWLADVDPELQATIREWVLEEKIEEKSDSGSIEFRALWGDLQKRLRRAYFQRENERIQCGIVEAEEAKDFESVRRLLSEKQDLLKLFRSHSEPSSGSLVGAGT